MDGALIFAERGHHIRLSETLSAREMHLLRSKKEGLFSELSSQSGIVNLSLPKRQHSKAIFVVLEAHE